MTAEQIQIVLAILGFLFGVVTKFVFDLWDERRKRQAITFTKRTINTFSINMLGEGLSSDTELLFSGEPVRSIQLVMVEVENTGARAVKNQAFTVKFDEKARIVRTPINRSNTEDSRFVRDERIADNRYRFHIQLLQKGHQLKWEFAVVDNWSGNFDVEHGISASVDNLKEVDLDVDSVITNSKAQIDLIARTRRIVSLLVGILGTVVIKDIGNFIQIDEIAVAANIVILILLFFLLRDLINIINPWFNARRGFDDTNNGINTAGGAYIDRLDIQTLEGDFIGRDRMMSVISPFRKISEKMAEQFIHIHEHIQKLPQTTSNDKSDMNHHIREILSEIQRGEWGIPENIQFELHNLAKKSDEVYQMVVSSLLTDKETMIPSVQAIIQQAYDDLNNK